MLSFWHKDFYLFHSVNFSYEGFNGKYFGGCPMHTDIMRFLTCNVRNTECHLDTKYKQDPSRTLQKKALRHHMTLSDANTKRLESHYAAKLDMYTS